MDNEKFIPKILSIDFDIIMAPCIKLYNDMCDDRENPTVIWQRLEQERGIENFLAYDATYLSDIAKLIKVNAIDQNCPLSLINNHNEIVEPLLATEDEFDLTNIDFHHDVLYYPSDTVRLVDMNQYNCGNWVYYLHKLGKLKSYTWVKAPQSDLLSPEVDFHFDNIMPAKDIKKLIDIKFNHIYFCLSPQWVPYKYHHLYQLIADLCRKGE